MIEKQYRICLSVPIGQRNGTIWLRDSGGDLSGWLEVMEHKNPFSGHLSDDGGINLSGIIQTLVSSIRYTATGSADENDITLSLITQAGDRYFISGRSL